MEEVVIPVSAFSASVALFVLVYLLVAYEEKRGVRMFAVRLRRYADVLLHKMMYVMTQVIRGFHSRVWPENNQTESPVARALFRHATHTPLTVTHTNNHLSKIREHKTETALSPAEQKKLRTKKLEERF